MALDYVPMLTANMAMCYGRRQKGCDNIPKYVTDWFLAKQPGIPRLHWGMPGLWWRIHARRVYWRRH